MNNIKNIFKTPEFILSALYCIILAPFYIKNYEVPDYFLYHHLKAMNLPAFNGYSTFFINFSTLNLHHNVFVQSFMLILMTSAMFLFLRLHAKINNKILKVSYIIFTFSLGSFWYFYGKIYYDFPFIIFLYAILLNCSFLKEKFNPLLFFLAGFCLSFKPYAIFPLFGLFFLLILYRNNFINYLSKIKSILFSIIAFLAGYVSGNYGFLYDFKGTIKGIQAAELLGMSNPILFFINDNAKIVPWDHCTNYSANTGILNIVVLIAVLFVIPIFIQKKYKYFIFFINIIFSILFVVFLKFFSDGLLFHGFPASIYFISLLIYLFCHEEKSFTKKQSTVILAFCILQFLNNFIFNVPRQATNFIKTNVAYKNLIKNKNEIQNNIIQNLNKEDKIVIIQNFQRYDYKIKMPVLIKNEEKFDIEKKIDNKDYNKIVIIDVDNYFEYEDKVLFASSYMEYPHMQKEELEKFNKKIVFNKDNIKVYIMDKKEIL